MREPSIPPQTRTAKTWRVTGTGLSGITSCAETAVKATAAAASAIFLEFDIIVIYLKLSLTLSALAAGLAFGFGNKRKKKYKKAMGALQGAFREYFTFLNSLVLGIGTDDNAKQLCKAMLFFDGASSPEEYLASLQLADGAAKIILFDADEKVDRRTYEEITGTYRLRKERVMWHLREAIIKSKAEYDVEEFRLGRNDSNLWKNVRRAKIKMELRYSHLLKPYARTWD